MVKKLRNPLVMLAGAALGSSLAPRLDLAIIGGISRLLKPVRAWAAAEAAEGDVTRWRAELGLTAAASRFGDRTLLRRLHRAASRAAWRHMIWESTLFNNAALRDASTSSSWATELAGLEQQRKRSQRAFHNMRPLFLPFATGAFPAIGAPPVAPVEAARLLSAMGTKRPPLVMGSALPNLQRSLAIVGASTLTYWLRWTTTEGDTGYARVIEPLLTANGPAELPSIVICHGLGVEYETAGPSIAFTNTLARRGLRIVLPEAAGHGKRRRKGLYGGEAFLRGQPVSGVTHLLQSSAEAAEMVAWCRASGSATVALAGSSLGAMTAQLAAARAAESNVPEALPDHLLLVTPTGNLASLAFTSSLAIAAGLDRMVLEMGWTPESFRAWSMLVEPPLAPPIDPAAISMVLGTVDTVTPYADGLALAQRWQIPEKNLAIAGRGHFTSSIAMALPGSALDKLAVALAAAV
ncbi:MAG: hypothetical protein ABWY00_17345 [Dongiaceae bacterium]